MRSSRGGLAVWAIAHPVSTVMISLAVVVLGVFAAGNLSVNLLPQLIYPQIRVRVLDPGVAARVMEDRVTRQLEEQLAITEDAVSVESTTREGSTRVSLSFAYGKDIDEALRDASTRLDRARRFLPTSIDPPIIYKMDPSQIPVVEYVVGSAVRDAVALRSWTDDVFAKYFLNLPGVAAVEVGGGLVREIHVSPDQGRLAGLGLTVSDVVNAVRAGNRDTAAGRLTLAQLEYGSRIVGRVADLDALRALPLPLPGGDRVRLDEVAQVRDTHEDNRLRVRNNGVPGVKMSIQKQPDANTIDVADAVAARLAWLARNDLVPADIRVNTVADQSFYVRNAMRNATLAAVTGAMLAMLVVYLFLGSLRRTLIIGSAIPIAIVTAFILMAAGELTLNIMTLGGIALGVGLLVDSTIVMLENITRHQAAGETPLEAGRHAAAEVNSAIVASTTTNLAAVLPFIFVGGLVGLLFRELIFTISAAIAASLVVALTLVPALAARVPVDEGGGLRRRVDGLMETLGRRYGRVVRRALQPPLRYLIMAGALVSLLGALGVLSSDKRDFLPAMDDGRVRISIKTDPGTSVDAMDEKVRRFEALVRAQGDVANVFTYVGGFIFGRTEREVSNRSSVRVQLVPRSARERDVQRWAADLRKALGEARMAGLKVRIRPQRVRGLHTGRSTEQISVRLQGPSLDTLGALGDRVVERLRSQPGLRNLEHSAEEVRQELSIIVDRRRAADAGLDVSQVGAALRVALRGEVAGDYLEGDRAYPIRVRLPQEELSSPEALGSVLLFPVRGERPAVYLRDVARTELVAAPAEILRDGQRRIVEVTASLAPGRTLGAVAAQLRERLAGLELPVGYSLYFGGAEQALAEGESLTMRLLGLALFLVFVVMAVQYESLRNPLIIMLCVPFAAVGVALGLTLSGQALSMPVWLGLIMLAGIVVNNSIVLVEYIELLRRRGRAMMDAVVEAAQLRLRPILMTTLTTVVGMMPLALAWGEGAEMLQPLALTIVWGLSLSMLVSLVLVPAVYVSLHSLNGRWLRPAEIPQSPSARHR